MNESEEFKFAQIALMELLKTDEYKRHLQDMSNAVCEYFNFLERNGIKDVDECEIAALSPAGLIIPTFLIKRLVQLSELKDLKWKMDS